MSRSRPSVDQCHTQPKQPAPIALAFKANRSALQRPEVLKGQLILKCPFGVFKSPQKTIKIETIKNEWIPSVSQSMSHAATEAARPYRFSLQGQSWCFATS